MKELEEHFEYEESRLKRFIKRTIILFMLVVLLILFLSYLGPGWRILNILEGQAASEDIKDFRVEFKNNTFNFEPKVYTFLKDMWFKNLDKEFKVCLLGLREGNNFIINNYYLPKVKSSSFSHVEAEFCRDSLISLHKHPEKSCIFSDQDIKYYEAYKEFEEKAVIGLMCEIDRFSFYAL